MVQDFYEKELLSKVIAMPANTNPSGNIFGGWIMSLMDIAAGSLAGRIAKGTVVTKAVKDLTFDHPILVGDEVSVYGSVTRIGKTSITLDVEVSIRHASDEEVHRAVYGSFIMVAVDEKRRPRQITDSKLRGPYCSVVNGFSQLVYS
ncbi:MAG: acyl-CoA thioesterase [Holosporales bacterium]|nr:acyl-CoA thioesterase [Holosporales bacterium]